MSSLMEQKTNQLAREFFKQDKNSEQKIALKAKLMECCLGLVWIKNNDCDSVVLMETIEYSIRSFVPEKGDFVNLFRSVYKKRKDGAENKSRYNEKFGGLKSVYTQNELSLIRDLEGILGKKFFEASERDLQNLCRILNNLNYSKLRELQQRKDNLLQSIYQTNNSGEEFVTEIGDERENPVKTLEDIEEIKGLFQFALAKASKIQDNYFRCFITLDLYQNYGEQIPIQFREFVNTKFLSFLKGKLLEDKLIADYMGKDKSNISKHRLNYREILKRARVG